MTDKEAHEVIDSHKTICCNSEYYTKSRLNYRCKECDKDITMELIYLHQALTT